MTDPLVAVAPYIGAPYSLRGRTPEGWDCLGCYGWLRARIFDRPPPQDWADVYNEADAKDALRAEPLFRAHIGAFRPVERAPGVAVLLRIGGRVAHVGLMLTRRTFVHCQYASQTCLEDVGSARWPLAGPHRRVEGFFDDR